MSAALAAGDAPGVTSVRARIAELAALTGGPGAGGALGGGPAVTPGAPQATFTQALAAASSPVPGADATTAPAATSAATAPTRPAAAGGVSGTVDKVLALGRAQLGVPYVWGGTTTKGFDCSGLIQYLYGQNGIALPRVAADQARAGRAVDRAQARAGDLVAFGQPVDHIGIYLGGDKMLVAPHSGDVVKVQAVNWTRVSAVRRVVPDGDPAPLPATLVSLGLPAPVPAARSGEPGTTAAPVPGAGAAATAAGVGPPVGGAGVGAAPAGWATNLPPAARPYVGAIESAAAQTGVDPRVLAAVAWTESGFTPTAVSGAGARGLMQLMPQTARGLGVNPDDPAQALSGGARYLAGQLQRFGRMDWALAAYNAGPTAVTKYGGVPPYTETQNYVKVVMDKARTLGYPA